jgi:hypothetical protein
MEIREALEKTTMAVFEDKESVVKVQGDQLRWLSTDLLVCFLWITGDYWQPYHPETDCPCGCREEKCEACIRLKHYNDKVNGGLRASIIDDMGFILERLCTCKEK